MKTTEAAASVASNVATAMRLSSSVIGGEMSCRRNVHAVGEVSSRRTVQ